MKRKRAPWRVIKNGSVEVVIYKEAAGYRVAWYFAGQRGRKFKVNAEEAVSFATKQAASLGAAQPKNVAEVDAELRYHRQLVERMGGTPLQVAVDFWLQHHARDKIAPAKLRDLFTAFHRQLREDEKSPGYIDAFAKYVRPYVTEFPGLIHEQAATQIDAWMRRRSPSLHSRKHFLNYLKTLFNWARDVKKALPKGETEADMVKTPEPKPGAIEIYTPDEMRLLLAFAKNNEEIALLALGGFAGLRNSEITGEHTDHGPLRIEHILFDNAAVRVVQKVQRKSVERYAPLLPNALSWLEPLRGKTGPVVSIKRAHRSIAEIVARVNKAHAAEPKWEPMRVKRNGLRRSHISYHAEITRDVARVADECKTPPPKRFASTTVALDWRKWLISGMRLRGSWLFQARLIPLPPLPTPHTKF